MSKTIGIIAIMLFLAPSLAAATPRPDRGTEPAMTSQGVVNLNTATEEELALLPGVGPTRAQAILAHRKRHGNFRKVDEITRVKGFGAKTLKKLRSSLTIVGPTTLKGKPSSRTDEIGNGPPPPQPTANQ